MLTIQEIKNAKPATSSGSCSIATACTSSSPRPAASSGAASTASTAREDAEPRTVSEGRLGRGSGPKGGRPKARRSVRDQTGGKEAGRRVGDADLPPGRQGVAHAPDAGLDPQARFPGLALPRNRHPADAGPASRRPDPAQGDHGSDRGHRGPRCWRDRDSGTAAGAGRLLPGRGSRLPRRQSGRRTSQSPKAAQEGTTDRACRRGVAGVPARTRCVQRRRGNTPGSAPADSHPRPHQRGPRSKVDRVRPGGRSVDQFRPSG